MLRRDYTALKKIADEISVAIGFMGNSTLAEFLSDELLKRGVAMTAINIGELVKNLSSEFRLEHNDIPWKDIAGFRDLAAHKYGSLNMTDVYITVTDDFPDLKSNIDKILASES